MRAFVVIGQRAISSPDFLLEDVPGTGGRLDALLHGLRSGLLYSHGLRADTRVYLVLLGTPDSPRTVRVDGATAKFIRPDERALAGMIRKTLAEPGAGASFAESRPGVAIANAGIEAVLEDLPDTSLFVLEEGAEDVRTTSLDAPRVAFFLGDHMGFDPSARARLASLGARPIAVGPKSLHAADVIAIVTNELDRRDARLR